MEQPPRQAAARKISIHAPHTGCDYEDINLLGRYREFQSTHPIRGATSVSWSIPRLPVRFQSTHPIRGATIVVSISAPGK